MRGRPTVLMPVETGEAVRSYADRTVALSTRGSRSLAQACFGASWAQTDWALPTNLEQFAKRVGARVGHPDTGYWVQEHTLAPFYSRTLSERRTEQLQVRLARPTPGRRAPLVAFSMEEWFAPSARLCPACDDLHLAEKGFSWIHRCWLLPFVTRCDKHGELLQEYPLWTPRERGPRRERTVVLGRQQEGLRLAQRSREMLECEQSVLNELAALLTSRGFKRPSGQVRRAALLELVSRHARGRSEHLELAWLLETRDKLSRLLSPLWTPGKVTLHSTVAMFVLDALREQPEVQPQLQLDFQVRQAERQGTREALREALASSATTTQAAKKAGVSVTTAVVCALAAGLSVRLRPKVLKKSMRAKVEALLAAGKTPIQIAAATKLSLSTIYRVLRASQVVRDARAQHLRQVAIRQRKDSWTALMVREPDLGTTELRRLNPAAYTYLYRHARKWLDDICPAKRRATTPEAAGSRLPSGADDVLAAAICEAAHASQNAKATSTRLLALGDARASSLKAVKAPLARTALREAQEPNVDFVLRRLRAAVEKVSADGHAPAPWRVLRASGLRATTVSNAQVRVADVICSCRARRMRKAANA
jgi:hypothetical protein